MDHDPIDPTKPEGQGAAEGAGDDDEDYSEWKLPDGFDDTPPDPPKSMWERLGARPKNPYQKVPQDDKRNPTFPPEKKGLPSTSKDTEETSFIEGNPSGRVLTSKDMATQEVEQKFRHMDHNRV